MNGATETPRILHPENNEYANPSSEPKPGRYLYKNRQSWGDRYL